MEDQDKVSNDGTLGPQDFTKMVVQDTMKLYYSWLYPYHEMYRWLSYGNDGKYPQADATYFQRREFCFTLDGDVFVRYQSFKDDAEMHAALRDRCPSKIDIGPVYNVDPQRRAAYSTGFLPVERELVFDIDLTDYDDVRTCGSGAHICRKCWPLMAAAIAILDRGLREDFGFKHILFVYSGRRGVHAWVCDARARRLTDEQRTAIASYFALYKGQEKGLAKLASTFEDHPSISRAYDVLKPVFVEQLLSEQRFFDDSEHMDALLAYLPSEPLKAEIKHQLQSARGKPCAEMWNIVERAVAAEVKALESRKDRRSARALEKAPRDIVFAYTYPRLDMEVSKKMNHLLKAPFCVHPKTGKVCVPIDPSTAWEFDPDAVATVGSLLNQLNAVQGGREDGWRRTDMGPAVDTFKACFCDALQFESRSELMQQKGSGQTLAW